MAVLARTSAIGTAFSVSVVPRSSGISGSRPRTREGACRGGWWGGGLRCEREDGGEIGLRVDAVQFCRLEQRLENGPVLAPPSDPANSAVLPARALGRMARLTTLESISVN